MNTTVPAVILSVAFILLLSFSAMAADFLDPKPCAGAWEICEGTLDCCGAMTCTSNGMSDGMCEP